MDLGAIVANARAIRRFRRGSALIAVVKADGYGHGIVRVGKVLEEEASLFGVFCVQEGEALRRAGIRIPILVMSPVSNAGAGRLRRSRLTPTVATMEDLHASARPSSGLLDCHLKFDTGMGRLGFDFRRAGEVGVWLKRRGVRFVSGLFMHFTAVYEPAFASLQIARLETCIEALRGSGVNPLAVHSANSGAVIRSDKSCASGLLRPGILLYGYLPGIRVPFDIRPAMSFKSRVISVRDVPAGTTVSYGHTYTTRRRARLAVVSAGYSRGYSRLLSNRAEVLVRGRRAPVRGRVCMDMCVIDVGGIKGCRAGDEVTLFGPQGREFIGADELASLQGTIPYEVLIAAGRLNPRVYRGGAG